MAEYSAKDRGGWGQVVAAKEVVGGVHDSGLVILDRFEASKRYGSFKREGQTDLTSIIRSQYRISLVNT